MEYIELVDSYSSIATMHVACDEFSCVIDGGVVDRCTNDLLISGEKD